MLRLFIAEKPSVARDIAKVLGARIKKRSHLEGAGVRVAWCLGHLVKLGEPEKQDPRWKRWDPNLLPMLPRQLTLEAIPRTQAHFKLLSRLMKDPQVGEIINACDAGREGELIFRYLYQLSGCQKPVLRLWISSLTPQAIRRGINNLKPSADYDALHAAARCRAEADWLVGMNATRALSARADGLLSVGRVQTPTLAMIVQREQEIEAFKPEPYWQLFAQLEAQAGRWRACWVGERRGPQGAERGKAEERSQAEDLRGRLPNRERAEALAALLSDAQGQMLKVDHKRQELPPPLLHHLTSLQQLAHRRFGISAADSLKLAQSLYERHKLITYPRTDSRHLTQDLARTLSSRLKVVDLGPYAPIIAELRQRGLERLSRRFVDDNKVSDHHAIIPTSHSSRNLKLSTAEGRIYDLIVRRFLAIFHPPAIYARSLLLAEVNGQLLEARGRLLLDPGWERAEPPPKKPQEPPLPPVELGDPLRVLEVEVEEKITRPPPRYTEASLLGAMERAGRKLEDVRLRAAMREGGLGTPATRAATLETLLRRDYIRREAKTLHPQTTGRLLISAMVEELKSPQLTGEWEARLQEIAQSRQPSLPFRRDIRAFVAQTVAALLTGPSIRVPGAKRRGQRSGGRRRTQRSAAQSGKRERRGNAQLSERLSETSRSPKSSTRRSKSAGVLGLPCPLCKEGQIILGQRGWGCGRWREGCNFVLWFEMDGVQIPLEEAERLLKQGRTRLFAKRGAKSARLALNIGGPQLFRWEQRGGKPIP